LSFTVRPVPIILMHIRPAPFDDVHATRLVAQAGSARTTTLAMQIAPARRLIQVLVTAHPHLRRRRSRTRWPRPGSPIQVYDQGRSGSRAGCDPHSTGYPAGVAAPLTRSLR